MNVRERFPIRQGEHTVFVGRNGSGKSTLARNLLIGAKHVLVIDPKAEFGLQGGRVVDDPGKLSGLDRRDPSPVLYRPRPEFWEPETYDGVFRWVYERKNTTIYVDEVYAVMDGTRAPTWYKALLTRGRSLKIRCYSATQRPAWVPLQILTEATHYFMFALTLDEDKKRMAAIMGRRVLEPLSGEYNFYYYNVKRGGEPREFSLKLGGKP